MKVVLKFSTERCYHVLVEDYIFELDSVPNIGERVNAEDILSDKDYNAIYGNCSCWSGTWAEVIWKELRKDESGLYYELDCLCEDK